MKKPFVTPEMNERIVTLRNQGMKLEQIAAAVKLTKSGVHVRLLRPENACRVTFRWQDGNPKLKRSKRNMDRSGWDKHLDEDFE